MKPIELTQQTAAASTDVAAISINNLSKCYQLYEQPHDRLKQFLWRGRKQYFREFWALRDVSFEVGKGEVLGIIGRNGAGKSTLLQLLCGTLTPTSGNVQVNGRITALLELGAGFNPEFSGRENVYLSASIMGLPKHEIDARFEEIVDFSGIREFIDQPVKTYSSGMYVRLAFSVATSVDPDILVVDEALSVGDGEFARKSFDRIRSMKEAGKTILFCSHTLYQVEVFCDRVLWLDHGECQHLGKSQDVVQRYSDFLLGDSQQIAPVQPVAVAEVVQETVVQAPQGYARFTLIEVSLDGNIGHEFSGRPTENHLSIRVQFASDPELPVPSIGFSFKQGAHIVVACAVSLSEQITIQRDEQGRGEVQIDYPALPLRKGEYLIFAHLGCETAVYLYETVQIATLTIDDTRPEPGLVDLAHSWQTLAGHSKLESKSAL
ncbi:MAG: polysaccharide ABC transporter ATP-binding protein [Methylobacter sp.]|nr:polysaccharide ABC transporter ATP-binding protein [Methylobacter sp.]